MKVRREEASRKRESMREGFARPQNLGFWRAVGGGYREANCRGWLLWMWFQRKDLLDLLYIQCDIERHSCCISKTLDFEVIRHHK